MPSKNLVEAIAKRAGEELKSLLETKHLYQSTTVTEESIVDILPARRPRNTAGTGILRAYSSREDAGSVTGKLDPSEDLLLKFLLSTPWKIVVPGRHNVAIDTGSQTPEDIEIPLVRIKTNCGSCGQQSPMNLVAATDAVSGIWDNEGSLTKDNISVYALSFQCQDCRDGIEVFLVSRENNKWTLVGRSPMEQVDVPMFIPKAQRKYYSGAVIAFNSGQVLPALFMLRVLIEQCALGAIPDGEVTDDPIEAYMKVLPADFNSRFPSLKELYGGLSDAIHEAREDSDLFQHSLEEVEKHFDAKRVYDNS